MEDAATQMEDAQTVCPIQTSFGCHRKQVEAAEVAFIIHHDGESTAIAPPVILISNNLVFGKGPMTNGLRFDIQVTTLD